MKTISQFGGVLLALFLCLFLLPVPAGAEDGGELGAEASRATLPRASEERWRLEKGKHKGHGETRKQRRSSDEIDRKVRSPVAPNVFPHANSHIPARS